MLTVRILVFVFAMSRGWAFVRLPAKTTGITLRRPRYFHTPASATRPPQVDSAPASTATSQKVLHPRPVIRLERPTRLPVWPAWSGIAFIILDLLKQSELAAFLEEKLGGRVAPMMLDPVQADPFILLVHHRHSFFKFDPLRALFRVLMPEGFPAHPHRGFETVTYVLPEKRGLVHRDSLGLKMRYGNGDAQWMTAGRGVLHEEMWDNDLVEGGPTEMSSDAELYQLWLNLPPRDKMTEPAVQIVSPNHEDVTHEDKQRDAPSPSSLGSFDNSADVAASASVPLSVVPLHSVQPANEGNAGAKVRVLAGGNVHGVTSATKTHSPVTICHATLEPGGSWSLPLPPSYTALVYVRKGSVTVLGPSGKEDEKKLVKTHHLAYLGKGVLANSADVLDGLSLMASGDKGADVMLFAGEPIGAPVKAEGTMVMNTEQDLRIANRDYQRGDFGRPWDHTLDDAAWRAHVIASKQRT